MQSINFSTGFKEYAVNGDENNVIKVNVSDLNMLSRFNEAQEKINALADEFKNIDKPTPEQLAEADIKVRDVLNYTFGSDVCTPAFGNTNCFSPVSDGKFLFEAFMEAFIPLIERDMKAVGNANKIHLENKTSKYTAHLNTAPITVSNQADMLANLTPEQKDAMLREMLNK